MTDSRDKGSGVCFRPRMAGVAFRMRGSTEIWAWAEPGSSGTLHLPPCGRPADITNGTVALFAVEPSKGLGTVPAQGPRPSLPTGAGGFSSLELGSGMRVARAIVAARGGSGALSDHLEAWWSGTFPEG